MSRRWLLLLCVGILIVAQGCAIGPPALPPAPMPQQTATAPATSTTLVATTATGSAVPTSTARAVPPGTPVALTTPGSAATATVEPRLGLNPPGTPAVPSTPTATPTPVLTGRAATISEVQGTGTRSPLIGQTVQARGIVTAGLQDTPAQGFFLQERALPTMAASTGIFVFQGSRLTPELKVGDEVVITGVVSEVATRTQLDISRLQTGVTVLSSGNPLPPPIELRPPAAATEAASYFRRYLGMMVSVPQAVVIAPTAADGSFSVVRADTGVTRLFASEPRGAGWRIGVAASSGAHYSLTVGDQVTGLLGPLDLFNNQFWLQQLAHQKLLITASDRPISSPALPQADEFTIASFNLENFFDPLDTPGKNDPCDYDQNGKPCKERVTPASYALKLTKAGQAIRDLLGSPTIVAVQEVENIQVLSALAQSPELAPAGYSAVLLEGLDPRGINVGLLYRHSRVTVEQATQINRCTAENLSFAPGELTCSTQATGVLDGHWLAVRPPLVLTLTVRNEAGTTTLPLTLIVNHWKAKSGTDPSRREFVDRRVAEATLVAETVNALLAADPEAAIIVAGDLNDFVDSPPLQVLTTTTPLRDLATSAPAANRYSYIYQGLSQILDHLLVTPNLQQRLVSFRYTHGNADYPEDLAQQPNPYRVSDHDPPVARFRLLP